MRCQEKRHGVQRASGNRTEGANSNVIVPWGVTRVNHGRLGCHTLGLETDRTEELRVTECVIISDRHEHGPQRQVNDRWNHALEVVASLRVSSAEGERPGELPEGPPVVE